MRIHIVTVLPLAAKKHPSRSTIDLTGPPLMLHTHCSLASNRHHLTPEHSFGSSAALRAEDHVVVVRFGRLLQAPLSDEPISAYHPTDSER